MRLCYVGNSFPYKKQFNDRFYHMNYYMGYSDVDISKTNNVFFYFIPILRLWDINCDNLDYSDSSVNTDQIYIYI